MNDEKKNGEGNRVGASEFEGQPRVMCMVSKYEDVMQEALVTFNRLELLCADLVVPNDREDREACKAKEPEAALIASLDADAYLTKTLAERINSLRHRLIVGRAVEDPGEVNEASKKKDDNPPRLDLALEALGAATLALDAETRLLAAQLRPVCHNTEACMAAGDPCKREARPMVSVAVPVVVYLEMQVEVMISSLRRLIVMESHLGLSWPPKDDDRPEKLNDTTTSRYANGVSSNGRN